MKTHLTMTFVPPHQQSTLFVANVIKKSEKSERIHNEIHEVELRILHILYPEDLSYQNKYDSKLDAYTDINQLLNGISKLYELLNIAEKSDETFLNSLIEKEAYLIEDNDLWAYWLQCADYSKHTILQPLQQVAS